MQHPCVPPCRCFATVDISVEQGMYGRAIGLGRADGGRAECAHAVAAMLQSIGKDFFKCRVRTLDDQPETLPPKVLKDRTAMVLGVGGEAWSMVAAAWRCR